MKNIELTKDNEWANVHINGSKSYFEYENEDFDYYVEGSLNIENGKVIDFDGCFDLPDFVKELLADNNIKCDWV